ncbi:MAG: sigma-70 family RNA polymerase sigma factor [Chloroflexota bacterium]
MDELALARSLAAGDEEAFRHLVDLETPSVFRTCYRILGRVDEAEDATQETFVLAYRSLASFRGEGRPGAWLTRIATRECWRRAAQRNRRNAATTSLDEVLIDTLPGATSPLGEVLAAEERARVRQAVESLGEPYREVVALRFFGELSLLDIAAATGRPEGTIKAQLHRGLERMRRALGGEGRS